MNVDPERFGKNEISELKRTAKNALGPVYGEAAAVIIVRGCVAAPMLVLTAWLIFQGKTGSDVAFLTVLWVIVLIALAMLAGALTVGSARYFFNVASLRDPQILQMFGSFRAYPDTVAMYLLKTLLTLVWSLLFVVPGVIAALGYAMTPYIMAVCPGMKATEALRLSKQLMRGRRRSYFRLLLGFSGWYLLCLLTAGLGIFFIAPYIETAKALFFTAVAEESGALTEVEAERDV